MAIPSKIIQEIQKRLLEIETYRSHYLYKEARICCEALATFIQKTPAVKSKQAFLTKISKKVKQIERELETFSTLSSSVEMSPHEQSLVRQLFVSGKGGSASADFETATALLVFGQRSAALKAFQVLLGDDTHRVAAAKSIIRCHVGDGHIQKAANEYLAWFKDDSFPPKALESVRKFLQAVLTKKGYKQKLPEPVIIEEVQVKLEPLLEPELDEGDYLSIVLPFVNKRFRKQEVVLDVNFQRGRRINCIVPGTQKNLSGFFKAGSVFHDVQINGAAMVTFCSVRLTEVSKIRVGRHAGDTTITMEVMDDD
jgi:hypothetical protein